MMHRRAILLGPLALMGASLAGCDESNDEPTKVVATEKPHDLPSWLSVKDNIEPALWLREREVGHDVLPIDPEVDRIRHAMNQLSERFFEDRRMIANRTAQTADILAEVHQPERYVDIMTGMVDVADTSPQKKLYGEMCQHYINVRRTGKDRTSTLRQLVDAYGRQGNNKK